MVVVSLFASPGAVAAKTALKAPEADVHLELVITNPDDKNFDLEAYLNLLSTEGV
jgi:hypothetical protein